MLDIAFDLIGEATSNSLLMFCFCNLIIVMILTGSSKPSSTDSQDSTFTSSVSFNMCRNASDDDEKMTVAAVSSVQDESLINDSNDSDEDEEDRGSSHGSDDDEKMIVAAVSSAQDESLINELNDSDEDEEDRGSSHCSDDDDEDEIIEAEVEEAEEDDELRKRAEEFIAKINNEWRHEKLKALNLVY